MTAINSAPSAKPWVKKTNRVQRTWPAWLISIFAAGTSIVSILLSIQQSSGAFQVRKEIRQDLASFISTLQSILLKAEVDPVVSMDYEMEQVKEFFNSSTLLFVASYYCESDKSIFEMSWIDFVSHIRDVLKYNDEMVRESSQYRQCSLEQTTVTR